MQKLPTMPLPRSLSRCRPIRTALDIRWVYHEAYIMKMHLMIKANAQRFL